MKTLIRILIGVVVVAVIAGGGYLYLNRGQFTPATTTAGSAGGVVGDGVAGDGATITIQPASTILGEVSAAGHIELQDERYVTADVGGEVKEIPVAGGQWVAAGTTLVQLDTVELERAAKRAELAVESSANSLADLTADATAAEIASAQAAVTEAQENLDDVLAGPTDDEIAAAESSLASSWSKYNELRAGAGSDELTQLSADLRKKEVALAEAQRNYDAIAWRENLGMTAEAATLQEATIDYEAAKAAYAEATAPADDSELQSALSAAQSAQVQLDELRDSPTEAQIATAQAQLASAQATLDDLLDGADAQEVRNAEISLEQALLDLEEAYANLAAATITAPMDGAVLEISATRGEQINAGAVAATMADTGLLELTIDVAEVDIVQVAAGQPVDVEIDALSGRTFAGVVDTIAPATDATTGVVSYPVTIRLTDDDLTGVRPGMTAVATIRNTTAAAEGSWLVPTSAIQTRDGVSQMTVVRGESSQVVTVEPGAVQGEWTVVRAPDLQAGDRVQGSLASYVNESSGRQFGGPGNGGPPPGVGGGSGRP